MSAPAIAFGPLPSRRLGQSLGVNHIPPKHCSYGCAYCQAGRTTALETERRAFFPPEEVVAAVERKVGECRTAGLPVDHLTFAPDGEPTLDVHLGEVIRALRPLGIPIAVITNGSLLWRPEVREDLAAADLVSVKVDAVDEVAWRRVCRPPRSLDLAVVLAGIRSFAAGYRGRLLTETMLVRGRNDDAPGVEGVADFVRGVCPVVAYLAVSTRPPEDPDAQPPGPQALAAALGIFSSRLPRVVLLAGEEDAGAFGRTGHPVEDLLAILAVHPMREDLARRYLEAGGAGPEIVEALLAEGRVVRVVHLGRPFLRRGPGGFSPRALLRRTASGRRARSRTRTGPRRP